MIASDLPTATEHLRQLIENASVIIPFTGAGISTQCRIPDFRSPGGGNCSEISRDRLDQPSTCRRPSAAMAISIIYKG
jgi:NAD-dependent protein deacetylases, SIR2 family